MSKLPPAVPSAWVADLFRRFAVLYGAQRMAVMYPDQSVPAVVAEWSRELAAFPPSVVAAAVESLPKRERAWPPTLPEFLAIVAEHRPAPEHRRALPVPARTAEQISAGRERMAEIRALLGRRNASGTRQEGRRRLAEVEPVSSVVCTCWTGLNRAQTLCESCSTWRRGRDAVRLAIDEIAAASERTVKASA